MSVELPSQAPGRAPVATAEATHGTVPATIPALAPRVSPLARLQAAAGQLVPQTQYWIARLGVAGQAGLAAFTAAAVIAVSTLIPAQRALESLTAELVRAQHLPGGTSLELAVPRLIASLPTRAEVPAVLGAVYAQAKAAGVALEKGRYTYTPPNAKALGRYDLEFPVKAGYPQIRTFIDRTLTAVPAAALTRLRVERKAVGDAAVNADVGFAVFVRSE